MKIKLFASLVLATAGLFLGATAHAADTAALGEPAKSVYDHYLKIQTELAKDSLKGVEAEATAIAKASQADAAKTLPAALAGQAEILAKAPDLKAARAAFKPLSASLIKNLANHKAGKEAYQEVYCPMAKAGWLQEGKKIRNPYFGKEMLTCGELK